MILPKMQEQIEAGLCARLMGYAGTQAVTVVFFSRSLLLLCVIQEPQKCVVLSKGMRGLWMNSQRLEFQGLEASNQAHTVSHGSLS